MTKGKIKDISVFRKAREIEKVGKAAVQKVLRENKRRKIASVLYINGTINYLMPDGKLTTKSPFKKSLKKKVK